MANIEDFQNVLKRTLDAIPRLQDEANETQDYSRLDAAHQALDRLENVGRNIVAKHGLQMPENTQDLSMPDEGPAPAPLPQLPAALTPPNAGLAGPSGQEGETGPTGTTPLPAALTPPQEKPKTEKEDVLKTILDWAKQKDQPTDAQKNAMEDGAPIAAPQPPAAPSTPAGMPTTQPRKDTFTPPFDLLVKSIQGKKLTPEEQAQMNPPTPPPNKPISPELQKVMDEANKMSPAKVLSALGPYKKLYDILPEELQDKVYDALHSAMAPAPEPYRYQAPDSGPIPADEYKGVEPGPLPNDKLNTSGNVNMDDVDKAAGIIQDSDPKNYKKAAEDIKNKFGSDIDYNREFMRRVISELGPEPKHNKFMDYLALILTGGKVAALWNEEKAQYKAQRAKIGSEVYSSAKAKMLADEQYKRMEKSLGNSMAIAQMRDATQRAIQGSKVSLEMLKTAYNKGNPDAVALNDVNSELNRIHKDMDSFVLKPDDAKPQLDELLQKKEELENRLIQREQQERQALGR